MKPLWLLYSLFISTTCFATPTTLEGTETQYQLMVANEKLSVQINTVELGQVDQFPNSAQEDLAKNTQALADLTNDNSIVLFKMEGDHDLLPESLTRNWKHLLVFEVPKKLATQTIEYSKQTSKNVLRWPDPRSWAMTFGYYLPIRLGVSYSIMLSKGVAPEIIHHYLMAEGLFSVLHYAFHHTFYNFYNLNTGSTHEAENGKITRGMIWRWTKNFCYDVFIYNNARWNVRGKITPWTQTVLGDGVMGVFTNIIVNAKKDRILHEKKYLSTAYGFFLVPINCMIQTIAQMGHETVLKSISIFHYHLYDIRPSTGINLFIALLLHKVIMKHPEPFIQKLEWINDKIILPYKDFIINSFDKIIHTFKIPFQKSCNRFLGGKKNEEDVPLEEYDSLVINVLNTKLNLSLG